MDSFLNNGFNLVILQLLGKSIEEIKILYIFACSVACMLIFLPRRKKASFKVYIKVTYKVHIQSPHKQSPYKVHGIYHTTPPTAPTTRTPKFYGPTLPTSPTPNFDLCHSRTHTPTRRTRPHNPRNLADWFYATTLRSLVYQF